MGVWVNAMELTCLSKKHKRKGIDDVVGLFGARVGYEDEIRTNGHNEWLIEAVKVLLKGIGYKTSFMKDGTESLFQSLVVLSLLSWKHVKADKWHMMEWVPAAYSRG